MVVIIGEKSAVVFLDGLFAGNTEEGRTSDLGSSPLFPASPHNVHLDR